MIQLVKDDLRALAFLADHGVYPDRIGFQGVLFVGKHGVVGAAGIDRVDEIDGRNHNAMIHSAGRSYWAKFPLTCLFTWLFIENGFHRLTAECRVDNTRSMMGMRWLGFRQEGIRREAAPDGGDMAVFGLLARDCRLITKGLDHG